MDTTVQVSVVIPTRNRPDLLIRAVRSVLAQTMGELEVIVVIDGPDEATEKALAELDDARVRPLPLPESGGAPNARNQGVLAARAPWTAMLDDDDEWLPIKLEVQLAAAADAGFARPIVASRLLNKTPRADYVMPRRLPEPGEHLSEYFLVRKGLFHGEGFIQTSTIMTRTELLREVPFTVGLRRQQELDWTLRAIRAEGVGLVMVDEPLVLWYQDENRERISLNNPWEEQLAWQRANRELFTPRAYAALTLSVLSSMAATTRDPKVFRELLKEARENGKPGAIDYVTHAQLWAIPPHLRHVLRDKILGRG
jgi:glycosyltransferase involved in cell wall biosynthesis